MFGGGQLLLGLSLGAENANEMGYRQVVTPDRLQGRMNATMRSINRAMIVIGAPVGGALGDAIGYRPMIWAAAGGFRLSPSHSDCHHSAGAHRRRSYGLDVTDNPRQEHGGAHLDKSRGENRLVSWGAEASMVSVRRHSKWPAGFLP